MTLLPACRLILLWFLTLWLSLSSSAADLPLAGPSGFSFAGAWNCSGNFVRSGKIHRSTYEGRVVAGDAWIELVETDIEPKGYVGHYLIGYDANKKQIVELDANSAGYAIYGGDGWKDKTLTLTMTEMATYSVPKNRFVFEVASPESFTVTWETNGGVSWAAADRLTCQRAQDPKK